MQNNPIIDENCSNIKKERKKKKLIKELVRQLINMLFEYKNYSINVEFLLKEHPAISLPIIYEKEKKSTSQAEGVRGDDKWGRGKGGRMK